METNLREKLVEIKKLTESATAKIAEQNYDEVENIMDKRKSIIDELSTRDFSKQELNNIYIELKINECQDKLIEQINANKHDLTETIRNSNKAKKASKNYMSTNQKKSIIFNKEV